MRVKGGKTGSAPAKRPPAADSAPAAALTKRPRAEGTAKAVPKQHSAAQNGKNQHKREPNEEQGLAGLLGEQCDSKYLVAASRGLLADMHVSCLTCCAGSRIDP